MGVIEPILTVSAAMQQKKAYKQEAQQAALAAEANITDRTRALNEAMAMQNAMMGASGRGMESIGHLIEGDKKRFTQDTSLIRATAGFKGQQYQAAGKYAAQAGALKGTAQLMQQGEKASMLAGGGGA